MKKYLALDKRELTISVILVILFIGLFNYDVGSIRMLYWGITLGCSGLLLLINRNWKIDGFIVWYLFFLFLSGVSLIWSINASTSLEILKSLMVNVVVLFAISNVIRSRKDVVTVMRAMLIAFVSNAVYMILKIDWSAIGNNRFDPEMTGEGWNANALGLMAIWGLALPRLIFMTCPTRNCRALPFPALNSSAGLGLAAMASATNPAMAPESLT